MKIRFKNVMLLSFKNILTLTGWLLTSEKQHILQLLMLNTLLTEHTTVINTLVHYFTFIEKCTKFLF